VNIKKYFLEEFKFGKIKPIFYSDDLDGGGMYWIEQMKNYEWPKVNSLMEMCCGHGFMGYYLKNKYNITKLVLVDIHEPVKNFIDKTNTENGWESEVDFYISNSFKNYKGPKVDMIVSNPPHLKSEEEFAKLKNVFDGTEEKNRRILLDNELTFHKNFLKNIDKFLVNGGILVLLENKIAIPSDIILSMNPKLTLIDYIDHNPKFLYTGVFKLKID